MTRRWLIAVSFAAHLCLAFGLFAAGVWHIEQLPAGRHRLTSLAVMGMPAPSGGGPIAARKVDVVKKPVHTLVQPVPKPELVAQAAVPAPSETPGEGSGTGSGHGDDPTGPGDCLTPPCGIADVAHAPPPQLPPEQPPHVDRPKFVPPVVIEALRISGDTQIHPPGGIANEMVRDGRTRTTAAFRVCLTETGEVASVALALSTKYPAYDAALADGLRSWRYRPYLVDGRPTAVCGNVTFIYAMH